MLYIKNRRLYNGKNFFVLFNKNEKGFYIDEPNGLSCITINIFLAERYSTIDVANSELSYLKYPDEWCVKKVTMRIEE